jgi:hypothetical protein
MKRRKGLSYEKSMVTGTYISFLCGGFQVDGTPRTMSLDVDPDQVVYPVCDPEDVLFPPLPEPV